MMKSEQIERPKKSLKKEKRRKFWIPVSLLLGMVILFALPIDAVLSPNQHQVPTIVFQKSMLQWSTHEIVFPYFIEGSSHRRICIDFQPPFSVIHVDHTFQFPTFIASMLHATVLLQDPAQNEIECQVWIRVFQNTDAMVFVEFTNELEMNFPLHYALRYSDENLSQLNSEDKPEVHIFQYSKEDYWEESTKLTVSESPEGDSKGDAMFGQFSNEYQQTSSFYTGRVFPYKTLDGGIYQHIDDVEMITYTDMNDNQECCLSTHTMLSKNSSLRDWFVFSAKPLMDIESAVTQKILLITDFGLKKGYFQDGFYYSTYLSGYLNESPQGFYWDYSMYAPRSILEYYFEEDQHFLSDICMNSLVALLENRNSEGYWSNGTISKWLQEEYGIQDQYFDTRFCTDAALFMLRMYETFEVPEALVGARKIGDILVDGIRKGFCYETPNYGFMLQDYFIYSSPSLKVHTSLNHLLNEASFLILLGEATQEETYTNAAIRIINGIVATDEKWKNTANGDLHYAMLPSGEFGLQDYVTLTYHDLIRFRSYTSQYLQEEPAFVQNLGSWKEEFLVKKNIVHSRKFTGSSPDLSPLVSQEGKR